MPQVFVYHAAHVLQVESNTELEQRLSSLQSQIESLRQAAGDDVRPLEQRLTTLTDYSAGILRQWAATADRHAKAVSQLEGHLRELGDAGTRLQEDAHQRLRNLERIIQQEWTALRDIHQAPVRQLVEQAANLTEVCIATANSAQHGFDRAEARMATLEADFHRTSSELTREVQALLAEVRQLSTTGPRQLQSESPAWPLEDVTRLHQQLRRSEGAPRALVAPLLTDELPVADVTAPVSPRHEPIAAPPRDVPGDAVGRSFPWRAVAVILVVVLAAGGFVASRLQRDVRVAAARAEQSQLQAQIAEQASREAADKQQAADLQLTAARDLATRAQTIGDVLAAPDLIRYTLVNPGAVPGASGQALWSRSRGFVFSASGLPVPATDTTYQVWLLTRGGAVSAATFLPDAAGRVTVTTTPNVPRPVYGAIVTTEKKGGSQTPTGDPVLARLPVVAPAQP